MSTFNNNSIDSIATDSPYGISFMNRSWDKFTPKSFENFSYKWGLKAIEILKPGSYLINFSHPRRYHRMVCGLEDAGFFIKDMIIWVNGQGFPKNDNYLKPSIEPIVLSQKPYKGSVKDNLEKWRVG
ncbi:MAG: DNA methyltransferase, partial [Candidatus Thorarchaeota archaeon]